MSDETLVVVCSPCVRREPNHWRRFILTMVTEGNVTYGICPVCKQQGYIMMDHGEIDFGV